MTESPIETSVEAALAPLFQNNDVQQVVDAIVAVAGTAGAVSALALTAIARIEAVFGLGPEVSVLLRSKLTADGAHAAQVQADALEAARLAELAGSK